jgi:beta-galactosidase
MKGTMMKNKGRNNSGKETPLIWFLIHQTMIVIVVSLAVNIWVDVPMVKAAENDGRKEINFNRDWKFMRGEQEGAEASDFNDSGWLTVRLPHDWAIAGPFDPNGNGSTGKLPWRGAGWYRKTFSLNKADAGKRIYFIFDGVMAFPKVYMNGQLAGQWDYGYTPFLIDATDYVEFGRDNVIVVSVDTKQHGSRWYPGAGIYRDVMMVITNQIHVEHWGTFITTPYVSEKITNVKVRNTIENHLDSDSLMDIAVTLFDPDGKAFAKKSTALTVPAGSTRDIVFSFPVLHPHLWDITSPDLYHATTTLSLENKVVDTNTATFGIRSVEFTPDDGFYLNGRHVQIHGVCLHHDLGPLGSAFNRRAMERELEIMRDMGANAIRTSHNPPARGLIELCDRMGLVVVDEAFDKWNNTADRVDDQPPLEAHGRRHLRSLVMRDRNSPSVVLWSIGNEIGNSSANRPGSGKSPESVTFMSDFVRQYDPTRPVTMGCHIPDTAMEPILDALDVVGYNYGRRYGQFRKNYPQVPLFYSESASTVSTRGFYAFPFPANKTQYDQEAQQVSSYDLNATPWSDIPDVEFYTLFKDDFLEGEFVWTGFDYLGEPTPFRQARSSYFGIVDLCGIPKDRYYLYRSQWRPEETTIHILPHWNWPDRAGQNVPVFVYTNGDSAELFLNGKSLGIKTRKKEVHDNPNLILNKDIETSSQQSANPGNLASDGDRRTAWRAKTEGRQWWQVDLGRVQPIGYCLISFAQAQEEPPGQRRGRGRQSIITPEYAIKTSSDGQTWNEWIASQPDTQSLSRAGGFSGFWQLLRGRVHESETAARYVRIEFTSAQDGVNGLREFELYKRSPDKSYYDVVDLYRLRWNDVVYEPGQLRTVAYKNGEEIGQATMNTAGKPAKIRLTPDHDAIQADGCDLSYILVEVLDDAGTPCPLAENMIHFSIEGPAEIAGVGNGNQNSLEPFQADHRKLFYGKAMLIIRSKEDAGRVTITASSDGVSSARVTVQCR